MNQKSAQMEIEDNNELTVNLVETLNCVDNLNDSITKITIGTADGAAVYGPTFSEPDADKDVQAVCKKFRAAYVGEVKKVFRNAEIVFLRNRLGVGYGDSNDWDYQTAKHIRQVVLGCHGSISRP